MPREPSNDNNNQGSSSVPDLGYPIHLFIDTSIFDELNYQFGSPAFGLLLDRIEAGDVRLLLPEITNREVVIRMKKLAHDAREGIGRAKKLAHMLDDSIDPLNAIFDWQAVQGRIDKHWADFLGKAKAVVLQQHPDDSDPVMKDFFASKPPFGGGNKKNEFPDAFAIATLRRYAQQNKCKVAVISRDGDFKNACSTDPALVHVPNLPALLEYANSTDLFEPDVIRSLLEKQRLAIEKAIVDSFADRGFYWETDEGHDTEVVETYGEEMEDWNISVIDVQNGWAEVAGEATITFKATATYPDPNTMHRDPDTKDWLYFGDVTATLAATEKVPVTFLVNVKALQQGKLDYDDLVVNNGSDVWFSEDEIEELKTPDYSE